MSNRTKQLANALPSLLIFLFADWLLRDEFWKNSGTTGQRGHHTEVTQISPQNEVFWNNRKILF